uniref:Signal peptidase I n=1 Tax=Lactuca sativa TaxID=4236 RepID=A0A9R1X6Y8_LACSA|nr:hypothetical protein LSAT_V11C600321820 [Lactuca sativa]
MIVSSALILWKFLMCVTSSESPVVVVLSESMEPAFQRIPIVHRIIKVHERNDTTDIDILTKDTQKAVYLSIGGIVLVSRVSNTGNDN